MSKKLSMRVATHALIAGLALTTGGVGAATLATPALAAPADTAINTATKGSLTIHKRASDDPDSWQRPATGEVVDNAPGEPLNGAEFTIQKIDLDFNDPAKVKEAAELTPADAEGKLTGTPKTVATTGNGEAEFSDLEVGAYLVKESKTPAGKVGVKPFIAYIPMTNAARTGWNYDVHAYPKNTSDVTVSKELSTQLPGGDDSAKKNAEANVGDEISYDVESTKPVLNPDTTYVSFFQIYDVVPAGLTYVNDADKRQLKIGEEVLTDTDYTVTQKEIDGQKYVFYTLTKAGNQKLTDAEASDKVVGTFTFTVDKVGTDPKGQTTVNKGGVISDTAPKTMDPDNPDQPGTTPDYPDPNPDTPPAEPNPNPDDPNNPDNPESPGVEATWVKVEFKKKNSENKGLAGAKFNVYRCTKDGAESGLDTAAAKADLGDKVLEKQGDNNDGVFVSNDEGTVTINALRVRSDDVRGENGGYCLVETEAPAGYELLPSPYFFRVSKDDATREAGSFNFEVENTRSVGPKLPATGGMGVGLLVALGALIVGAGAFFARRSSKAQA